MHRGVGAVRATDTEALSCCDSRKRQDAMGEWMTSVGRYCGVCDLSDTTGAALRALGRGKKRSWGVNSQGWTEPGGED
jgi:hypothetical protein